MPGPFFLIILLVRLILAASGKRSWLGTAYVELVLRLGALSCAYVALEAPADLFIAAICVAFAFPRVLLSGLLVPAGVPHVTYYASRVLRPLPVINEASGSAVFDELRARVRHGFAVGERALYELGAPLFSAKSTTAVRGGTLAARASLDALEGNLAGARALFRVVQNMHWAHASRTARTFAQAWLLADAGQRGAYGELAALASTGPWTRRRVFLGACAKTLAGRRRYGRAALVLGWLVTPGRRVNFRLLSLALKSRQRTDVAPRSADLAGALDVALRLRMLPPGTVRKRELRSAALVWEQALAAPALAEHLQARRDALSANFPVQTLLERFRADLVASFAELWQNTLGDDEPAREDEPSLLVAAKDAVQYELLARFDDACSSLYRAEDDDEYDLEDLWRYWAEARLAGDTFAALLPERRAVMANGVKLVNYGAWLHNMAKAPLLAHDVFRWLLLQTPQGAPNRRLLEKNARIGRHV